MRKSSPCVPRRNVPLLLLIVLEGAHASADPLPALTPDSSSARSIPIRPQPAVLSGGAAPLRTGSPASSPLPGSPRRRDGSRADSGRPAGPLEQPPQPLRLSESHGPALPRMRHDTLLGISLPRPGRRSRSDQSPRLGPLPRPLLRPGLWAAASDRLPARPPTSNEPGRATLVLGRARWAAPLELGLRHHHRRHSMISTPLVHRPRTAFLK